MVVALTVLVALAYTTPWGNYLVATRGWYYDPAPVWNIVLGYVPLEEYLFFVLQTILGALELGWALPPIFLQWLVGWHFLWRERRAWRLAIFLLTTYLSLADSTALDIAWTITPAKSLGVLLGNVPLEKILFFLLINTPIVQSVILARDVRGLAQDWTRRVHRIHLGEYRSPERTVR